MSDSSLMAVRSEIEGLKSQISKSLNHANSRFATSDEMDDMTDYYGKRLEECQKQVTAFSILLITLITLLKRID